MSWWAVGTAVVGGLVSANQSNKAIDAQKEGAAGAGATNRYIYDQNRADQAPYRDAGIGALQQLTGMSTQQPSLNAADVMADPGYQFGLEQGQNNIQNTAAARGGLYSGNALKALTRYGNDYATTKYDAALNRRETQFGNRWGRLASLAGIGQTATNQTQGAGQAFGNNQMGLQTGLGNAQGANAIAQGNIWGNTINQAGSALGRVQWGSNGGGDRGGFRGNDPYASPGYFGGDEGE